MRKTQEMEMDTFQTKASFYVADGKVSCSVEV